MPAYDPDIPLHKQKKDTLLWTRDPKFLDSTQQFILKNYCPWPYTGQQRNSEEQQNLSRYRSFFLRQAELCKNRS